MLKIRRRSGVVSWLLTTTAHDAAAKAGWLAGVCWLLLPWPDDHTGLEDALAPPRS